MAFDKTTGKHFGWIYGAWVDDGGMIRWYVGQTRARLVEHRWDSHKNTAVRKPSDAPFSVALSKSIDKFTWEILERVEADSPIELACKLAAAELHHGMQKNALVDDGGYARRLGEPHFPSSKQGPAVSEALKKLYATGWRPVTSQQTRQKRSATLKIVFSTPEQIARRSEKSKMVMADPARKKIMSEASKKMWSNPELRKQRIAAVTKAINSPDVAARKSASMKAALADPDRKVIWKAKRKESANRPEVKSRKSESLKAWYAADPEAASAKRRAAANARWNKPGAREHMKMKREQRKAAQQQMTA